MLKAPCNCYATLFDQNMHIDHFKIGFQNSFLLRKQFVACEAKQKEGNWPFWFWDSKLSSSLLVDMDWEVGLLTLTRTVIQWEVLTRGDSVGGSNQGRLPHISYTAQGHQPTFGINHQRKKIFPKNSNNDITENDNNLFQNKK